MAEIHLSTPNGTYTADVDTGVMEVEIKKNFLGVGFVSENSGRLAVSERDGGFEVMYGGGVWSFNDGQVRKL